MGEPAHPRQIAHKELAEAELARHVWNREGMEARLKLTMSLARMAGYVMRGLEVDGRWPK
jgi:hypothetical protein